MKKTGTEYMLYQKRFITHFTIFLLAITLMLLNRYLIPGVRPLDYYISGFIVLFSQLEVFIFISYLLFRNINPGTTAAEITRTLLSRFALFLVVCLIAAFFIYICYLYIRQILAGGDLSDVIEGFFKYSFSSWIKSTLAGLSFGAVIFIVFLWQDALHREQKLREENLIFQNETLKNQINPHFLFNSLNTLASLIDTDPETSKLFIARLASIYRYILDNSHKDKVPLTSELAFVSDYYNLHKIRDEDKIILEINAPDAEKYLILPVSLQILLENAIKHNMATREKPLNITISIEDKYIIVRNNLQKMGVQLMSTKIGLKNLAERFRLVTGRALIIEETAHDFTVKAPVIP